MARCFIKSFVFQPAPSLSEAVCSNKEGSGRWKKPKRWSSAALLLRLHSQRHSLHLYPAGSSLFLSVNLQNLTLSQRNALLVCLMKGGSSYMQTTLDIAPKPVFVFVRLEFLKVHYGDSPWLNWKISNLEIVCYR